MAIVRGPRIVTDGLVFCANAADKKSYIGSGTSWRDLTQNGANGTLNGGMTFSSSNGGYLIGGAFDSGKYVNWGAGLSSVDFTTSNFTISIMLLMNAVVFASGQYGLLGYGQATTRGYYAMLSKTVSKKLSFFTNQAGNIQETISSDFSVYSGQWVLLSFVRTGSSVKIYANTTDITETAGTHVNPVSNTTNPLVLNAVTQFASTVDSFVLDAYFSSFMMYNKALSASELSTNFNSMRRRFNL